MINKIKINGLFGQYNVPIEFNSENPIKVYIGENGIGKTSVLTIINSVLTGDVNRILTIEFKSIEVTFNNKKYHITKDDMMISLNIEEAFLRTFNHLSATGRINREVYNDLLKYVKKSDIQKLRKKIEYYMKNNNLSSFVLNRFNRELRESENIEELKTTWTEYLNELNSNPLRSMYFPTYRRIEEDIHNMGVIYNENKRNRLLRIEDDFNEVSTSVQMLKSGMTDVQTILDEVEKRVKTASLESFNKVTGDMMTYLLKTKSSIDHDKVKITESDTNKIEVILDRISDDNLEEEVKTEILESLKKDTINEKESLAFFINSLLNYYKQQEKLETQIQDFVKTCNNYLVNKEFKYNESEIEIYVRNKTNSDIVELENLSSGEKQIISIFALIYLDQLDEKIFVLIDEPELSLSIIWQEMLLEDIYASSKVSHILAVTHSPFIYTNLSEDNVENMESIFEETKGVNM